MYYVEKEKCVGCGACISACPADAISMVGEYAEINEELCLECGRCTPACPAGAIFAEAAPPIRERSPFQRNAVPGFGPEAGRGMGRGLGRGLGRGSGRGPGGGRGMGRRGRK